MDIFKNLHVLLGIFLLLFLGFGCKDSSTVPVGPDTGQGDSGDTRLFSHNSLAGASAEAFLTSARFTDLHIEIDYMPGYEATQEAIDGLQSFLEQRLNKTTLSISTSEIPSDGKSTYTLSNVIDLEGIHRDNFTDANSTSLYVYCIILDGKYITSNALGIAYYNTSTALFGSTIETNSGTQPDLPSREKVEGTVLNHEFGHLLGLVGSGSPVQSDHKNSNSLHCTVENCLMNPNIENGSFFENFSGEVPELDQLCIEDLQANGGK